jgi:uncharacterized membrane protein YeiH
MIATVAFAVTGVLAVAGRGVDIFGSMVLGVATAVGGGTIRDVILGVPVFWSLDVRYLWVALGASIAAHVLRSRFSRRGVYQTMLYLDGFGAALFGIQSVSKTWNLDFGLPLAPVVLGVVTAIGGGLIRDVLAGRPTLLMSRELYAVPVMLGCIVFVATLYWLPDQRLASALICIIAVFALRSAAIFWHLQMPKRLVTRPDEPDSNG